MDPIKHITTRKGHLMKQTIKILVIMFLLLSLAQCKKEEEPAPELVLQVLDSVVTVIQGEQVDWTGVYVARNGKGEDLTGLVTRSVDDTTALSVGIHTVTLRIEAEGLHRERLVSLNVVLTDEEIIFEVPDTQPVFQTGGTVSREDFIVSAKTASGQDLSHLVVMEGYNLESLQTGFHNATFRIRVSETQYEEVVVPFEVRNGDDRIELVDTLENMNIRHHQVVGNLVYILGFHWEEEDIYDDLLVFDMEDESLMHIEKWAGNLHGTEPFPHVNWGGFTIHDDMIHVVGAKVDLVDPSAEGTDKFSYETVVDVYRRDLTYSHTYPLDGLPVDIPTNIAINATGEIAVAGYGVGRDTFEGIGLFTADHRFVTSYGGDFKTLVASGEAFVAAGDSGGYSSASFDGYAFMFDSEGMVWQYRERGFDMDRFTSVEATDEGFLLFGETKSHQFPGARTIGFTVRLDDEGRLIGRTYYPEAVFAFPALAHTDEGTWMVSFDVVRYPDAWSEGGWSEHRIPMALLYDDQGNLSERHTVYFEKYIMFEGSIVVTYGDALYVITSLGYHQYDEHDVNDPASGLFIVRIHQGQ